jgi:hypothetical protein
VPDVTPAILIEVYRLGFAFTSHWGHGFIYLQEPKSPLLLPLEHLIVSTAHKLEQVIVHNQWLSEKYKNLFA